MIEISSSARYDQSASTVFAIVTDPSRYPAWQADVESASLAGDASAQRGARIRQVRKVLGRRAEIALTISELVPGEQLTLATDPDTKPAIRQSWRLQPDDGGCRLDFRLNLDGVPRMAEHLARVQLSRTARKCSTASVPSQLVSPSPDARPVSRGRPLGLGAGEPLEQPGKQARVIPGPWQRRGRSKEEGRTVQTGSDAKCMADSGCNSQ